MNLLKGYNMNCSPTISAESFKQLHNGLWELDCLVDKLADENLARVAKILRDSLSDAYEQDGLAFERKNELFSNTRTNLGLTSIWSIYEVDFFVADHTFGQGKTRLVYKDHWGKEPVVVEIHGNTWASLWIAADKAIQASGDDHHTFIECFTPADSDTLILSTGS